MSSWTGSYLLGTLKGMVQGKRAAHVVLVGGGVLLAVGGGYLLFTVRSEQERPSPLPPVVFAFEVGGERVEVRRTDIEREVRVLRDAGMIPPILSDPQNREHAYRALAKEIFYQTLIAQAAREEGITVPSAHVAARMRTLARTYPALNLLSPEERRVVESTVARDLLVRRYLSLHGQTPQRGVAEEEVAMLYQALRERLYEEGATSAPPQHVVAPLLREIIQRQRASDVAASVALGLIPRYRAEFLVPVAND